MTALELLSLQDLAAAGRQLQAPFQLRLRCRLQDDGSAPRSEAIDCLEILRLQPQRRLVARVAIAGRPAVLKLFFGAGARRYLAREARGCRLLAGAGVATPRLLGTVEDAAHGLLFEALADARPVAATDAAAIGAAAALLGRLHQAGCRHRDLHLDNFLRRADGSVWMIDGDAVRAAGSTAKGLGRRRSLSDLAILCAQRPPSDDVELPAVSAAYAAERGWSALPELAALTRRQRRARVRRYLAKAQRTCTEFHQESAGGRWIVAVAEAWDQALQAFARDPERVFPGAVLLKDGNSATVIRARLGERSVVVKRYNLKGPLHALRRALRPMARYRLAWLNGQRLAFLGIPTARPLALVERRHGPIRGVAYLVMEDLGDRRLDDEIEHHGLGTERLGEIVELFRALAAAELVHGDTKASNFLIGPDGRLYLVDLDALRRQRRGGAGRAADRARFLANFDHLPALRQRLEAALATLREADP